MSKRHLANARQDGIHAGTAITSRRHRSKRHVTIVVHGLVEFGMPDGKPLDCIAAIALDDAALGKLIARLIHLRDNEPRSER